MILLPMEIIDKILSYRETHPVVKLIKNRYEYYKKDRENEFFKYTRTNDHDHPEYEVEWKRLYFRWCESARPYFMYDYNNYHWIIKHPDYNPAIKNNFLKITDENRSSYLEKF